MITGFLDKSVVWIYAYKKKVVWIINLKGDKVLTTMIYI